MKNVYISTVISNHENRFYSFREVLYSFISLEDIIKKSIDEINNRTHFNKNDYLIEIIHVVEDYTGNDLYLKMVQRFKTATYLVNYEGKIMESHFGLNRDFILSDFTEPENKFSIGDICEIYRPCDDGTKYVGTGVITRLRQDMSEITIDNPYDYNDGYWMSYISTENGNDHPESFGIAQEWLQKVDIPREYADWFIALSDIVKENKILFRDLPTYYKLQSKYIKE